MPLLLHVGFPKTGTSFLQERVWQGFPGIDLIGPAGPEINQVSPYRRALIALAEGSVGQRERNELIALRELGQSRALIVSMESLIGDVFNGLTGWRRQATRLNELFPRAVVLLTVREQAALVRSIWAQYINQGGYASLRTFLSGRAEGAIGFDPWVFEYDRFAAAYSQLWGMSQLLVVSTRELEENPYSVAQRTLKAVGIAEDFHAGRTSRSNVSLPPAGLVLMRAANRAVRRTAFNTRPVLPAFREAAVVRKWLSSAAGHRALAAIPLPAEQLSAGPRRALTEHYRESNERLTTQYSVTL